MIIVPRRKLQLPVPVLRKPPFPVLALSKTDLPALSLAAPRGVSCDIPASAISRWNRDLRAAKEDDDATISIYDPIGSDFFGEGVTLKRISAALRSIGPERNVVVNINSPGGDVFEGIGIYNILRQHKGQVTVRVLGLAASAASVIAMAGDRIEMGKASFMMIHNVWVIVMGNRNDLRDAADVMEPFDAALAEVYSARTGLDAKAVAKLMDAETWFAGDEAIEKGFADDLLPADVKVDEGDETNAQARDDARAVDAALAKSGMTRSERRALLARMNNRGTLRAASEQEGVKPRADPDQAVKPGADDEAKAAEKEAAERQAAEAAEARAPLDRMNARLSVFVDQTTISHI